MKKLGILALTVVTFFALTAASASAAVNDVVRVGLRYGSTALFSANLENQTGSGYAFGYYDDARQFVSLGETDETAISMTAAGTIYVNGSGTYSASAPTGSYQTIGAWHVQLEGQYGSFREAQSAADRYGGYPAYISGSYVVRVGGYESRSAAETGAQSLGGSAVQSSSTGVLVTVTRSTRILFEFDCGGSTALAVLPWESSGAPVTWFKGYRYCGGFEYPRAAGGNLSVINVVSLEDYVRGVLPSEMGGSWPLAALEAQAVCARTYASAAFKHLAAYGFDVCAGTDCQVYNGISTATALTDQAVAATAGERLYYNGALVQNAVYHSSNGGSTEDGYYVWGTETGYLKGKADPYEAQTTIPDYSWSVTYTAAELTWILQQKGYNVGTVTNVYVSEYTPQGNVYKVTFEHTGGTLTVKGDTARSIFYSSTYNKSVKSLRFTINGASPTTSASVYVNGASTALMGLDGVSVISGSGKVSALSGTAFTAVTASGTTTVTAGGSGSATQTTASSGSGTFTITGTGNGHNVGLSQYGAKAMAELGYSYRDILEFYYTGITIR